MQKSESIANLAAALVKARAEIPAIGRNSSVRVSTKSGGSYTFDYATLDHILDAVVPVLSRHGLSVSQGIEDGVVTMLMHESGEYLIYTTPFGKLGYSSAQDLGGIITYLRRYALSAVLGIVADEDDDGNAASNGSAPARRQAPPRPAPRPAPPPFERRQAVTELLVEAEAHGFSERQVLQVAGTDYGVSSIDELTDEQAGALLARLQKKATA